MNDVEPERVVIGRGHASVVLQDLRRSPDPDPYGAGSFTVIATGDGASVMRVVFMLEMDWQSLVAFFESLAADWRGFEGVRSWGSIEGDIKFSAVSDDLGHNNIEVTVRQGPVPGWVFDLRGIELAAGEETTRLARSIAEWVASAD